MNAKFFAAALMAAAGFAASPSFAGDNATGEVGYIPQVAATSNSGLTREAVRNEYLQARRHHELPAIAEGAEVSATAAPTTDSPMTRAAVREQAVYAVHHRLQVGGEV